MPPHWLKAEHVGGLEFSNPARVFYRLGNQYIASLGETGYFLRMDPEYRASARQAGAAGRPDRTVIVRLRVRDYENQRRRAYLALREKGGQHRRVPVHSRAAEALDAYLEAAGIGETLEAPLFQAIAGKSGELAGHALTARSALRIVKRRASAAGIGRDLGCHSCRATGITAYLVHGGTLERAATIAGHASTRTTQLYDRRRELVEPDEIERVKF